MRIICPKKILDKTSLTIAVANLFQSAHILQPSLTTKVGHDTWNLINDDIISDLVINGSLVVPSGQFCQGQLNDSQDLEDIYLVCDTCLSGGCIQTCCPPGQVYAEDQSWKAPRCASEDDATSSVSIQ